MNKKKIIIFGLVIVLLTTTAVTILHFFDLNRLKPAIGQMVKHYTGRELTINGDIRLLAHWPPTLTVEDLAFQNAPWGSQLHMMRVKRAAFAVSFTSLLRGEFRFLNIRLDEPEVLLEFNPEGESNFLLDIPATEGDGAIPVLAFNDISIQNGYFEYNDREHDLKASVQVDDLEADIPGLKKPIRIRFDGNYRGVPLSLDGSIGPIMAWIQPGYTLPIDLDARLGGTTAQLEGEIRNPLQLKDISLDFSARGSSTREIADLIHLNTVPELGIFSIGAELTDESGKLAMEKIAVHIGSPDLISFSANGIVDDLIAMKGFDLDLAMQTRHTGNLMLLADMPPRPIKAPFSASVSFSNIDEYQYCLDKVLVKVGDEIIQGRMGIDLSQVHPVLDMQLHSKHTALGPLALNTRLRSSPDRISVEHLEFQMGHKNLFKAFVNGAADNLAPIENLRLNVHISGKDLGHLQKITHQPLPAHGPYAITGDLFMAHGQSVQVPELKIILDKNSISGSLELKMDHEHPLLHVNLAANRLNLERLLTPGTLPDNLQENLSALGPSRLAFEISGPIEHPTLDRIELQTQVENLATLNLKGSIKNLLAMTGADLHLAITGTDLANLEKVVGQGIPFKGPYSISSQLLRPDNTTLHIEKLKISAAANNFHGQCVIKRSKANTVAVTQIDTENLSLEALAGGHNTVLDRLRSKNNLGPLKVEATTVLSDKGLRLQALDLTIGKEDFVRMQVNGSMANLTAMQDMQFDFKISGREISNLEPAAGRKIPLQGAYALSGKLSGHAPHTIMLRNLDLQLARNHFTGRADLNLAGKHPMVESEISSDHLSLALISLAEIDPLKHIPDLGPFKLAFQLSQTDGVPAITHLDFHMGRESTIAVMLGGTIGNLDPLGEVVLDVTVKSQDLSILNDAYGSAFVKGRPFHVSGRLDDPRMEKITITSFEAIYGDSDLSGAATLDLSTDRPKIDANLSSGKADLRPFIKTFLERDRPPRMPSRSPPPKGRVFSREPFDLTPLLGLDANVAFQGRELLFQHMAVNDLDINLQLKKGDLNVDPLKFSIGSGTTQGTFALQSSDTGPFMAASLIVDQFDIRPMLQQLEQDSTFQGTLNTSIYLNSKGNSVAELMAGLSGKMHLNIYDGQIESKQLAFLERYMGSNVIELINPFIKRPTHTTINCFITTVDIKDGQADCKMVLDTEQSALVSTGAIDLKTERLDLGIKPTPKKGFGDTQIGHISFSLRELSQPFGLGGTLARPQLVVDPGRTVITAGKFAGAWLLGPVGLTLFFSDISLGKKNICEEASMNTGK